MRSFLFLMLGLCAVPSHAHVDQVSGYAGRVCYSDGSSRTFIEGSVTVCNDRVQQALLDPPPGESATSVNWCVLRGSCVAWPWCGDLTHAGFGIDPDDTDGGIEAAIGIRSRLEWLREAYRIDEYEQAEQAVYRGE